MTANSIIRIAIGGLHSYPALPIKKKSSVRGSVAMGTRGRLLLLSFVWDEVVGVLAKGYLSLSGLVG